MAYQQDKRKLRKLLEGQDPQKQPGSLGRPSDLMPAVANTFAQQRGEPVSFASAWRNLDSMETPVHLDRHQIQYPRHRTSSSSRLHDEGLSTASHEMVHRHHQFGSLGEDKDFSQFSAAPPRGLSHISQEQLRYPTGPSLQSPVDPRMPERLEFANEQSDFSPAHIPHQVSRARKRRKTDLNPYSIRSEMTVRGYQLVGRSGMIRALWTVIWTVHDLLTNRITGLR
jgi:hypothetical protein